MYIKTIERKDTHNMTQQEAIELLESINCKLDEQGRVVDDRLLEKKKNLEKLIASFTNESNTRGITQ